MRGGATWRWTGQDRDLNKRWQRVATVNKRWTLADRPTPPTAIADFAGRTQLQSITAGRRGGVIKRS